MKDIPGYENIYACDIFGKIYSLPRAIYRPNKKNKRAEANLKLQELKSCCRKDGYMGVALTKDSKKKSYLVHRLIGMTYLGLQPTQELNHMDGDKTNNNLDNLEICNRAYNVKHAFKIGLRSHKGINHPLFFIDEPLKIKARELLDKGISQSKIGSELGMSQVSVSKIKLGKI